ncbi:hypothetical protein GMLC_11580 [Geomonas limicola]|uniref:Uncharacterized protein n=1 Tax=Geomonas limicola TaxID=2740186 RepID=A0A6V8N8D6_9BACT|nr:hypothetical protein GMLC_11580 [Geomonas limicola]
MRKGLIAPRAPWHMTRLSAAPAGSSGVNSKTSFGLFSRASQTMALSLSSPEPLTKLILPGVGTPAISLKITRYELGPEAIAVKDVG